MHGETGTADWETDAHICGPLLGRVPRSVRLQWFKAKAHPFTGVDEADNWGPLHGRRHG
jgi:hypothetical protein